MRLSCNGCRVLRKGCSDSCSIRPSLQWIKTPDAQSNATVFLAKFYGRAGLLNLVNAAPENLRPSVFRSLLYEACGRIVNPIYGSVGLLWSCNWSMCQAAVEAVLKGAPIVQISSAEAAAADTTSSPAHVSSLHKAAYDIRHVASSSSSKKQPLCASPPQTKAPDADKPVRLNLKKRTSDSSSAAATCSNKKRKQQQQPASLQHQQDSAVSDDHQHDSAVSDQQKHGHMAVESSNSDDDAQAAGSHVSQAEHNEKEVEEEQQQNQLGLDLTLGLTPVPAPCVPHRPAPTAGDAGCSLAGTGTGWSASEPAFRFL